MPDPARYLSPAAVADLLGLDTPAVLRLISAGELIAHDLAAPGSRCHRWRIAPADLDALLLRRRSQTPSPRRSRPQSRPAPAAAYY